jgi:hypothetical protein
MLTTFLTTAAIASIPLGDRDEGVVGLWNQIKAPRDQVPGLRAQAQGAPPRVLPPQVGRVRVDRLRRRRN